MSDFFQNGVIATFHRLGELQLSKLEKDLKEFSSINPIGLVLPSLYREYASGALPNIMAHLKRVKYLKEIVLCLDAADQKQFKEVKKAFADHKNFKIIWNDGPRMKKLYQLLEKDNLHPGGRGKGRAVWIAIGYVLARGKSRVIALHDCDIVSYKGPRATSTDPVANVNSEYEFCKGYYSRYTDQLYGRATRLYFTPFMNAMEKILGYLPFLVYMDSFRYALSGEIALRRDLALAMRIPSDWGLEVGTLAEVYRNMALNRICQVDIADTYEHKHQELIPDNPERGILKMSIDITKSVFRTLATEGVQFSEGFFKTLNNIYLKVAQEAVVRYENDAAINHLNFDRHNELGCVEAFAVGIKLAGEMFWENPSKTNLLPNWHRVSAAVPEFFSLMRKAVAEDND